MSQPEELRDRTSQELLLHLLCADHQDQVHTFAEPPVQHMMRWRARGPYNDICVLFGGQDVGVEAGFDGALILRQHLLTQTTPALKTAGPSWTRPAADPALHPNHTHLRCCAKLPHPMEVIGFTVTASRWARLCKGGLQWWLQVAASSLPASSCWGTKKERIQS